MSESELTWVRLLQVFLQEAAIQEELKPRSLERCAGPTASHSSYSVCCLCTHSALVNSETDSIKITVTDYN